MRSTVSWQEFTGSAARQAGNLHLASVSEKLRGLHQRIRTRHPSVDRVAFALFDAEMKVLKTFINSTENGQPLTAYECALDDVPSLKALAESGEARVINDMPQELVAQSAHSTWLIDQGYLASLTLPITQNGQLLGFLFFDARERGVFTEGVVEDMLLFGHLIGMVINQELATLQMLIGSLRLAREFAHLRDLETGAHLERMARYARLIAREIAPAYGLGDDFVEHIFLFSPLHDIGKVGVPDHILLKPGAFTPEERQQMQAHVEMGLRMANQLISDFSLGCISHLDLLRNIIHCHHEYMDGSGYPRGLQGEEIPLEARVVATADVFDALACARSYKEAWSLADAFDEVLAMRGSKLFPPCVDALLKCRKEVEEIHTRFSNAATHYR